jgi:D-alanyl-D-alanine carboxypeptidase
LTQKSSNLRGSGRVVLGLVSVLAVATITLSPAEARHYRARVMTHEHDYAPPSSAIVVDANSGNVLYATSPDEPRHPASLTKIMTLYLLFERMEAGKFKLDTELAVSEHASVQAPTKLGLKPGQTIAVEDAIKGLVTKSANDAAVVVAEAIGGTESEFAEMMTKKARALGMSRTVYRNASGLPNDEQVTTARDQALLGRAIQERFPRQYHYFSTLSFTYHGESMRNHNMLLGHVDGVDGIKTGYTQASGFNLVTSVHRNNRHIVAVVLGGASAGARDAKMRSLIEAHIASASTQHTATAIAEAAGAKAATREAKAEARPAKAPATYSVASFSPPAALSASKFVPVAPAENALTATVPPPAGKAAAPPVKPAAALDVNDTIKPIQVKTIKVKLTQTQTAGLGPIVAPSHDEHAEAVAEPPPVAVAAPPPRAPAPKAAAIAAPVAAPVTPAPVTAPLVAAPVVAAPVAVAAAPVVAAPKTAPVALYAAAARAAAPVAPPSVAALDAAVARAPVAVPKTAPVAAAAPVATPPVAALAAPVAPTSVTVAKTAPVAQHAVAPIAAPAAAPSVDVVAVPVAPTSVTVPKTAPIAQHAVAPIAAPAAAPPVAAMTAPAVAKTVAAAAPMAAAPVVLAAAPAGSEASASEPRRDVAAHSAPTHVGWIVQVGAFDVERDAQQRLTNAHAKVGHVLDNADPFTETVMKGDKTLYRARFAGFQQKEEADAVCKQLKRNDIDCITIRN